MSSTQTFVITVTNDGSGNVFVVNGTNRPILSLVRGGVYIFVQSSATNVTHQIALKDGSGNAYVAGITTTGTPGSPGAQTQFTVAEDAPSDLRYYCVVHGNAMGNAIAVTSAPPPPPPPPAQSAVSYIQQPGGGSSNPGTGAKFQLAAVGLQDTYLRGPFSMFARVFRRSTRYAMWTDEIDMDYAPGKRSQVDIPKSGDLLADMTLQITLPAVSGTGYWSPSVGYTFLRRVRLLINDAEVHNYERLWYDLYDHLYTSSGHQSGLAQMVGRAPLALNKQHILHVPLRMLTGRKGASRPPLPLQAIPRASLKLDIDWETPGALTRQSDGTTLLTADPGIKVKVLCDYVELEDPEKTKALRGTTLAFESVIDSDATSYYTDSDGFIRDSLAIKVNLGNVRFAVKLLVWVAYNESGASGLFQYLSKPLDKIFVTFNNQDRLFPRPAGYFDTIQKYQHCARSEPGAPAVYSFALNATSRYPTGTADFGALSSATLQGNIVPGNPRFKLKVFSVYYNFLEIKGGTAKLVFV